MDRHLKLPKKISKSKNKRRPRRAVGKRNYVCGCGKAYLSYPALYTHVKNKHEGEFPIGSNSKRKLPHNAISNAVNFFKPDLAKFYENIGEMLD